jgi:hypothetical protein
MTEETKPRGQAVIDKPTIADLTLPDGSKRRVASRPVGDPELIYNWVKLESSDNPKRWLDLRDLFRFISMGDPISRLTRSTIRTLRGYIRGARRWAIDHDDVIMVKTDSQRGVTHFKLWDRVSVKEKKAAIDRAVDDLNMEHAWERRVDHQSATLDSDRNQLEQILRNRREEQAGLRLNLPEIPTETSTK